MAITRTRTTRSWLSWGAPLALLALALLALLGGACGAGLPGEQRTAPATATETAASAELRLTGVVDGDTLNVAVQGHAERVRLLGVNAPEQHECYGEESTVQLAALLAGGELALQRDRSERDRYGRLLRYVHAGGRDVGAALVAGGYALAVATAPDLARAEAYAAMEAGARQAGRGLWAADACGPASLARGALVVSDAQPDAPGPDAERLGEEWVALANDGPGGLALGGFVVRDQSASQRYVVPAGFVLEPGAEVRLVSGCGNDSASVLHWCSRTPIWNNAGDAVLVLDRAGNVVAYHRW